MNGGSFESFALDPGMVVLVAVLAIVIVVVSVVAFRRRGGSGR